MPRTSLKCSKVSMQFWLIVISKEKTGFDLFFRLAILIQPSPSTKPAAQARAIGFRYFPFITLSIQVEVSAS